MTIDDADLLVPPVFERDDVVLAGEDREHMTFGQFLGREGGRIEAVGGAVFDGDLASEGVVASPAGTNMRFAISLRGDAMTDAAFDAGRLAIPGPDGNVAAARLAWSDGVSSPLFVHCLGSGANIAVAGTGTLMKTVFYGDGVVFDYPGYGGSGGKRTIEALERTAEHVAVWADRQGPNVVLWGHSLGGFVCAEIAARMDASAAVIIETSATDARSAASYFAPWWARPFVRVDPDLARFDAVESLSRADVPVLVIGAGKDRVLAPRASRILASRLRAAGVQTAFIEAKSSDHFDAWTDPEVTKAIRAFLTRAGTEPRSTEGAEARFGANGRSGR